MTLRRVPVKATIERVVLRRTTIVLDGGERRRERRAVMKTLITFSALAASALALAACNNTKSDEAAAAAAAANEATPAAPVVLPPSVVASKTYRCRDSSVVYIDFLSNSGDLAGSMNANFRTDNVGGTSTQLTRADAETPYTAEGYSVSGSGDSVTIAMPGKNAQLCKA